MDMVNKENILVTVAARNCKVDRFALTRRLIDEKINLREANLEQVYAKSQYNDPHVVITLYLFPIPYNH